MPKKNAAQLAAELAAAEVEAPAAPVAEGPAAPVAEGPSEVAKALAAEAEAPKGLNYNKFNDAYIQFTQNQISIELEIVRDAIIEALDLGSSFIFNITSKQPENKEDEGTKQDIKTNEYDNMFHYTNPQHRTIIKQVNELLEKDLQLNKAINLMVAPENTNLQVSTKMKLKQLKRNLGVLQGLVLREKLKRGIDIDPLLDALNEKVKTLNSILAVQKTGNLNYQLGGSSTKLNELSNYIKYKMKYLTLKNIK